MCKDFLSLWLIMISVLTLRTCFCYIFLTGKYPFSEHNKLFHANKTTFRLGMNVHGDMTATEFAARFWSFSSLWRFFVSSWCVLFSFARFNGFHKKHPNSHGPWNPSSQVVSKTHDFLKLIFLPFPLLNFHFPTNEIPRWTSATCLLRLTGRKRGELRSNLKNAGIVGMILSVIP